MVKRCDALSSGLFSGSVSGQVVKEEQMVKAKAAAARRCQIERRDLESQIARELVERFPEFGYVDTDVRMIDNKTLRMDLREGKMWALANKARLTTAWWAAKRLKWQRVNSPQSLLAVANPSEPIAPGLEASLSLARSTNTKERTSAPLLAWLQSYKERPNQKSLAGLLKHALSKHAGAPSHLPVVLAIMKFCGRLRLHVHNPNEMSALKAHFDTALVSHMQNMGKNGFNSRKFMELVGDVLHLVLNKIDSDDVMRAASIKEVPSQLRRLVSESCLGARVFGEALTKLAEEEFSGKVDALIEEMLSGDVTSHLVTECLMKCNEEALKWQLDKRIPGKREIMFWYRGVCLQILVEHSSKIVLLKIGCFLKARGVARELIDQLWFEKDILGEPEGHDHIIEIELMNGAKTCRQMMNAEAEVLKPSSGEVACQMIQSRLASFVAVDDTAEIELALAKALSSGPGAEKLHEKMMTSLPMRDVDKELTAAIAELEHLCESALFNFTSRQAQGVLTEIMNALRTMARGYSPNFVNWMTDNKLKMAKERLPFFFKFDGEQAENGLEKKLEDVKLKMSNDEIVDLVEMQPFSVFSWLLSKEKLAEAGAITEKLFRETSYVPEAKALEDISPDTPLNKKKRVSKASTPLAAAALDNVANLFV